MNKIKILDTYKHFFLKFAPACWNSAEKIATFYPAYFLNTRRHGLSWQIIIY